MITSAEHVYFIRLAGNCAEMEMSAKVVGSFLNGAEPAGVSWTEKDPSLKGGDNPYEWSALGRSGDRLFMDFPGELTGGTVFSFKWLKVEYLHRDNLYEGMSFLRVSAAVKDKEMFALLGVFLLSRVRKQAPDVSAARTAHQGLKDWERYMGHITSPGVAEYTGVLGELYVLLRLVRKHGSAAVDWWHGPDKAAQDFVLPRPQGDYAGLEVKTGSASDTTVQVSGLRQLHSPGILLRVALGPSELPGEPCSVRSLVKDIERELSKNNESLTLFRAKVVKLALDAENPEYSASRCVTSLSHWDMADLPSLFSRGPRTESIVSVRWTVDLPQGNTTPADSDLATLTNDATRPEQFV